MILKASQRSGGKQLALHLLRADENEHVSVHELRGFVSEDLTGAFKEAYASSQGTMCRQFLFSVSLNPPQDKQVAVETFENAINRIEEKNGLSGHARAIVFHEKEGRRHAHAVWFRIDGETMTAKNLPYFKTKLRDLSREIYLEQGWQLPKGLMNSKERDPRNFTLAEWQQSKREGVHTKDLKEMMADCWAASDSRKAFARALEERGMMLAKGDRRGHVAVTHTGNILSVARYAGQKTKDVQARLGTSDDLPSADEAKAQLAQQMHHTIKQHLNDAKIHYCQQMTPLERERQSMTTAHRNERATLANKQQVRWQEESQARTARLSKGLPGLWQRITGAYAKIRTQNEREAHASLQRDRDQQQQLVWAQLTERQDLQRRIQAVRRQHAGLLLKLREDKQHYRAATREAEQKLAHLFQKGSGLERRTQVQQLPSREERLERLKSRSSRQPRASRGPEHER